MTGNRRGKLGGSLLLLAVQAAGVPGVAADPAWPEWRGPGRDGRVSGLEPPPAWPKDLKEEWTVKVGEGHSSPVTDGERVYLLVREGEEEAALALDARTGKRAWRAAYPAPYEVDPAAEAHGKGPKSTSAVAGGRLYTLGISGILSAFDAAKGGLVFRKDLAGEFPKTSPLYGTAASPLVRDGLLFVHLGGHGKGALIAFDAASGAERWRLGGDGPGYASPVIAEVAGKPALLTQTQERIIAVAPASGKLLFARPFTTPYHQNVVTPVVFQDLVIVSGLEQGITALRFRKEGEGLVPAEAWKTSDVSLYMSAPVVTGDLLFGFSHKRKGQLFCLDTAAGKVLWQGPPAAGENAALLAAGDLLLVLTTAGELTVLESARSGHRPLGRYKVASTPTWAHPLVMRDRILIKDRDSLRSWTWRA